jgi:hypothetical protein
MTDEEKKRHGHGGEDLGFERQDLSPTTVFGFLAGLAVAGVLIYFIVNGLYGFMDAYYRKNQPAVTPMSSHLPADTRAITPGDVTRFPQPRLETDERTELNGFRQEEEKILYSYGYADKNAGTVRIPIDRAMELIAQRGLPTRPQNLPSTMTQYETNLAGKEFPPGSDEPLPTAASAQAAQPANQGKEKQQKR